jgi:hypothetical protein
MHILTGQTAPIFELDSEDALYEDIDEEIEQEVPPFTKEPVPSVAEKEDNDSLKSELSMALDDDTESDMITLCSAVDEAEWNASPWASLLVETAVDQPVDVRSPPAPATSQDLDALSRSSATPSWSQRLVTLFAGRKQTGEPVKSDQRTHPDPDQVPASAQSDSTMDPSEDTAGVPSEHTAWVPIEPRLPLPQVIPGIKAARYKSPSRRPGYREIPTAKWHKYTGHHVVEEDVFTPTVVLRGFEVAGTPTNTTLPNGVAMTHARQDSRASLLERDNNTWTNWHSRHPSPERMPFARTRSVADGMHRQANVTQNGEGRPRVDRQMGRCVPGQVEDAYPCVPGLLW